MGGKRLVDPLLPVPLDPHDVEDAETELMAMPGDDLDWSEAELYEPLPLEDDAPVPQQGQIPTVPPLSEQPPDPYPLETTSPSLHAIAPSTERPRPRRQRPPAVSPETRQRRIAGAVALASAWGVLALLALALLVAGWVWMSS